MKKSRIVEMLKPFKDDDEIAFDGEVHLWRPTVVCGKSDRLMGYVCVKDVGHEGSCWCSCKNVYFEPVEGLGI